MGNWKQVKKQNKQTITTENLHMYIHDSFIIYSSQNLEKTHMPSMG